MNPLGASLLFVFIYNWVICILWQPLHVNMVLPLWGGDNCCHFPDDIFKCIILNENVSISIKISLKFVPKVKLTIFQHWFRWWLGTDQATSHYLNQGWNVYWCIYASLGLNEVKYINLSYIPSDKLSIVSRYGRTHIYAYCCDDNRYTLRIRSQILVLN